MENLKMKWHTISVENLAEHLDTVIQNGLTDEDAVFF